MIDESRPEKERLGSIIIVESISLAEVWGLLAPLVLGGSVCPGLAALIVKVRGVVNLEILNVLALGVALKIEVVGLLGEPFSATLVGDCRRLAGDPSSEALNGEFAAADFGTGKDGLNGD
jgi:hypothetical protein